jgi:hypothetical protein
MSYTEQQTTPELTALAPDPETLSDRGRRAWTERMAVESLGETYAVESESGARYVVDPASGTCSCPDHRVRGETCKHLRRVAIEITAGRLAPPGTTGCVACGADVAPTSRTPLCGACSFDSGEVVLDRETGDRLVVARTTDRRADETELPAADTTVAAYPTNDGYPDDDPVVEAVYAADVARRDDPRRYVFPHSRLSRTDDATVLG